MDSVKDQLLKPRLREADVEVPGLGVTVRVRGVSRAEVVAVRKATDDEEIDGPRALVIERKMIAMAMVDPVMTEDEVAQWQQAAGVDELQPIVDKIQELSGLDKASAREAYKRVRG